MVFPKDKSGLSNAATQPARTTSSYGDVAQSLTRRQMLLGAAGSLAMIPTLRTFAGCSDDPKTSPPPDATPCNPVIPAGSSLLIQPEVLEAVNGRLDVTLEFGFRTWNLMLPATFNGSGERSDVQLRTRGYLNETKVGSTLGPTLKLRAGDEFRINLVNQLPVYVNTNPVPKDMAWANDCANVADPVVSEGPPVVLDPMARGDHQFNLDLNITNVHVHGVQVTPICPGDYIFNTVEPETSFQYEYGIVPDGYADQPPDATMPLWKHTAGTFWYHPHRHGAVAPQMFGGGIGVLIIEGALDDYLKKSVENGGLGLKPENDLVMAMSHLLLPANLPASGPVEVPDLNVHALTQLDMFQYTIGANGKPDPKGTASTPYVLLNGQLQPTLVIEENALYRLRFVNGTVDQPVRIEIFKTGTFQLNPPMGTMNPPSEKLFTIISVDGVTVAAPSTAPIINPAPVTPPGLLDHLQMAPGNRVDVLLQMDLAGATEPVVYDIVHTRAASQWLIGHIIVCPSSNTPVTIPDTWPASENVQEPRVKDTTFTTTVNRKIEFQILENGMGTPVCPSSDPTIPDGPNFTDGTPKGMMLEYFMMWNADLSPEIDPNNPKLADVPNGTFSPNRLDVCATRNENETWTVTNYSNMMHPFHIHVNPIFVTRVLVPRAGPQGNMSVWVDVNRWQDTVAVPGALLDMNNMVVRNPDGTVMAPGAIEFKARFLNFVGDYVAHCHKVTHEDLGMMINVRVADENGGQPTCPADYFNPDPPVPYQPANAPAQCKS